MAINLDLFKKVVAPEFATMADADIELFATEAEIEISEKYFGTRYPRALCLVTAHLVAMSKKKSDQAGPLRRTKVGQLEREFAVSEKGNDDAYMLTTYGKEFVRLRRQILATPRFIS